MKGIERRLCSLEARAEPSKGFKVRNRDELEAWRKLPEGTPLDFSETSDEFLRAVIDFTKEGEEGEP